MYEEAAVVEQVVMVAISLPLSGNSNMFSPVFNRNELMNFENIYQIIGMIKYGEYKGGGRACQHCDHVCNCKT